MCKKSSSLEEENEIECKNGSGSKTSAAGTEAEQCLYIGWRCSTTYITEELMKKKKIHLTSRSSPLLDGAVQRRSLTAWSANGELWKIMRLARD